MDNCHEVILFSLDVGEVFVVVIWELVDAHGVGRESFTKQEVFLLCQVYYVVRAVAVGGN